jgi:hypothetical protein
VIGEPRLQEQSRGERCRGSLSPIPARDPSATWALVENRRLRTPARGRKRRSCVTGHLLRVRLTERALSLTHCASEARFRLSQCAAETGFYCALGRSLLRAAIAIAVTATDMRIAPSCNVRSGGAGAVLPGAINGPPVAVTLSSPNHRL